MKCATLDEANDPNSSLLVSLTVFLILSWYRGLHFSFVCAIYLLDLVKNESLNRGFIVEVKIFTLTASASLELL